MERKLKAIFEFQRFEKNAHLDKLISETENRYARKLSDDELTMVNAAGELPNSLDPNNSGNFGNN